MGRLEQSLRKLAYAKSPDFDHVVQAYKDLYGIDLSNMKMKWSKHPVYNNGKRSYELDDDETAGSWVNDGTIRINPNMRSVMDRFKVDGRVKDFRKGIIAHELAHEVWHNQAKQERIKKLIRQSLAQAKKDNFTTKYLDTYPEDTPKKKFDSELFAEWMSHQLNKQADAYDKKKWPDYEDYLKKHPDPKIELVERLVREHYAKQRPWGMKMENGSFIPKDKVTREAILDAVVRDGDDILRQRRGMCHELAAARMKMLKDNGIEAHRAFAFWGEPATKQAPDGDWLLGHSMVFFRGDDGKIHFASPKMRDRPRKNFGRFDDLKDAIRQYIAAIRDSGGLTDDDFVRIYDTTDVKFPDRTKYLDYVRRAKKGPVLYEQAPEREFV